MSKYGTASITIECTSSISQEAKVYKHYKL
jgi:hypothetical protein